MFVPAFHPAEPSFLFSCENQDYPIINSSSFLPGLYMSVYITFFFLIFIYLAVPVFFFIIFTFCSANIISPVMYSFFFLNMPHLNLFIFGCIGSSLLCTGFL